MAKAAQLTLTADEVRALWMWSNHIQDETTMMDNSFHAELREKLQKFLVDSGHLQPIGYRLA